MAPRLKMKGPIGSIDLSVANVANGSKAEVNAFHMDVRFTPNSALLVVTGDQVWNGSSNAWIYQAAVAAIGALFWFLIARRGA